MERHRAFEVASAWKSRKAPPTAADLGKVRVHPLEGDRSAPAEDHSPSGTPRRKALRSAQNTPNRPRLEIVGGTGIRGPQQEQTFPRPYVVAAGEKSSRRTIPGRQAGSAPPRGVLQFTMTRSTSRLPGQPGENSGPPSGGLPTRRRKDPHCGPKHLPRAGSAGSGVAAAGAQWCADGRLGTTARRANEPPPGSTQPWSLAQRLRGINRAASGATSRTLLPASRNHRNTDLAGWTIRFRSSSRCRARTVARLSDLLVVDDDADLPAGLDGVGLLDAGEGRRLLRSSRRLR